jgi:hypothetical protein
MYSIITIKVFIFGYQEKFVSSKPAVDREVHGMHAREICGKSEICTTTVHVYVFMNACRDKINEVGMPYFQRE